MAPSAEEKSSRQAKDWLNALTEKDWIRLAGPSLADAEWLERVVNLDHDTLVYRIARAIAEGCIEYKEGKICVSLEDQELDEANKQALIALCEPFILECGPAICMVVPEDPVSTIVGWRLASAIQLLMVIANLQHITGREFLRVCKAPSAADPSKPCENVFVCVPYGRPKRWCSGACRARASRVARQRPKKNRSPERAKR